MSLTDPTQSRTTDYDNQMTSYTAGEEPWNKNLDGYETGTLSTDAITYNCDFRKWHWLYRNIPELRAGIDIFSLWVVGKKIKFKNSSQEDVIKRIKGNGKQTFREILLNTIRTSLVAGDCFVEIIRDKAKRITNLKILDPGSVEIRANNFGIIKQYAQISRQSGSKIPGDKTTLTTWTPDEIFHLRNDAIADEIHGIPEPEKLLKIIKMRHQALDMSTLVLARYGKPTFFFEANTDDETELAAITAKLALVKKNFEDAVFPKGTLDKIDRVSTPQYSSIDPMPWHNFLRSYSTEASGVPDLIRGKSDEVSLAAGKLNYLGFKEKIEMKQLYLAEQIEVQLGFELEFEPPQDIDIEVMQTNQDKNDKENAKETKKVSQGKAEIQIPAE